MSENYSSIAPIEHTSLITIVPFASSGSSEDTAHHFSFREMSNPGRFLPYLSRKHRDSTFTNTYVAWPSHFSTSSIRIEYYDSTLSQNHTPFLSNFPSFKISGIRFIAHFERSISSLQITDSGRYYQVPAWFQTDLETPVVELGLWSDTSPSIRVGAISTPRRSNS